MYLFKLANFWRSFKPVRILYDIYVHVLYRGTEATRIVVRVNLAVITKQREVTTSQNSKVRKS